MNNILHFEERYKAYYNEKSKTRNVMEIPRIKYVVISAGFGRLHKDNAKIEYIADEITNIAGQKCVLSKIKKSISNFAVREGATVGAYVTLRGKTMKDFMDRLVLINLPRMQELTGLPHKSFDSSYNYNIGLQRQDIFVESKGLDLFGLNICIVINGSKSKNDSLDLLRAIGLPINIMGGAHAS